MKKTKITYFLALALSITACSKDSSEPAIPMDACYDYVTLQELSSEGSVFTMQVVDDSPLISYLSDYTFKNDTTLKVGDRLIISYKPQVGEPYHSGNIKLYGYRYLDNSPQQVLLQLPDSLSAYDYDPLSIQTIARSGSYINVQAQLSCLRPQTPVCLMMVAESESLDQDYPLLHIVYRTQNPGQNAYTSYCSFDISEIWDASHCKGVVISAYDGKGQKIYQINK